MTSANTKRIDGRPVHYCYGHRWFDGSYVQAWDDFHDLEMVFFEEGVACGIVEGYNRLPTVVVW